MVYDESMSLKEKYQSAYENLLYHIWEVRTDWWYRSRFNKRSIRLGDIYEDCTYHPRLCTFARKDQLYGVSLIDGSGPRGCSMDGCGTKKLSPAQAVFIKENWETYLSSERAAQENM